MVQAILRHGERKVIGGLLEVTLADDLLAEHPPRLAVCGGLLAQGNGLCAQSGHQQVVIDRVHQAQAEVFLWHHNLPLLFFVSAASAHASAHSGPHATHAAACASLVAFLLLGFFLGFSLFLGLVFSMLPVAVTFATLGLTVALGGLASFRDLRVLLRCGLLLHRSCRLGCGTVTLRRLTTVGGCWIILRRLRCVLRVVAGTGLGRIVRIDGTLLGHYSFAVRCTSISFGVVLGLTCGWFGWFGGCSIVIDCRLGAGLRCRCILSRGLRGFLRRCGLIVTIRHGLRLHVASCRFRSMLMKHRVVPGLCFRPRHNLFGLSTLQSQQLALRVCCR